MSLRSIVWIMLISVLVAAIGPAYIVYCRALANEKGREANAAFAAAKQRVAPHEQALIAYGALLTDDGFRLHRSTLTARALEVAESSVDLAEAFTAAAEQADVAATYAVDDVARSYWLKKKEAHAKTADAFTAAAQSYRTTSDPAISDLETLRREAMPFADHAGAARADANRLYAEAEKIAVDHGRKY